VCSGLSHHVYAWKSFGVHLVGTTGLFTETLLFTSIS